MKMKLASRVFSLSPISHFIIFLDSNVQGQIIPYGQPLPRTLCRAGVERAVRCREMNKAAEANILALPPPKTRCNIKQVPFSPSPPGARDWSSRGLSQT